MFAMGMAASTFWSITRELERQASLLHELQPETWDRIFNTNVRGAYYMMRAVVPLMMESGGGHIINISSLAGKNPLPRGAAYSASKWALNGLSYSVAEELRSHNIRVSVVCPGIGGHRIQPARRKVSRPDAASRRRCARGGDAGDAASAVVCERSSVASHPENLADEETGHERS